MTVLDNSPETVQLENPGSGEIVHFRYPSFAEWHSLAKAHRELDGATPPAELIARTLTTCLCDADGKPLGVDQSKVLKSGHRRVMWLYDKAWQTVLRSGDSVVGELEKNSAAGQD